MQRGSTSAGRSLGRSCPSGRSVSEQVGSAQPEGVWKQATSRAGSQAGGSAMHDGIPAREPELKPQKEQLKAVRWT